MSFSHFLRSTTLTDAERAEVDGVSPLDRFEEIQAEIARYASVEVAQIFCEPVISEANGAAPTSISWYAAYEGDPQPLTALDGTARQAAEALVRARIEALRPVIAQSGMGQLIAMMLYVPAPEDVYVIGGEPVLTNWGVGPEGAFQSDLRSKAAYAAGLGALGVALTAPPLQAAEWDAWRSGAQPAVPTAPPASPTPEPDPAPVTPDPAPEAVVTAAPVAPDVAVPWYRRAWAPALFATLIALLILVVLLIPGVLLYPEEREDVVIARETEFLRDSNDALEERLRQLRAARETGQCTAEGDFLDPDGETIQGARPAPLAPGEEPVEGNEELDPAGLLPPLPDQLQPPEVEEEGLDQTGSLLDHLDRSVVLVLAPGEGGLGIGTGFFVNGDTVVTNDHVIRDGNPNEIFVTSQALGSVVRVRIDARSGEGAFGTDDFAILSGDFGGPQHSLPVAAAVSRLENVIAAGFPAIISTEDARFRQLVASGDASAAPLLATTRGVVTSVQDRQSGGRVIAHDADISQGNSGGPLVDMCGRVVGVNTFTTLNRETVAVARYSLHATMLMAFLDANNVSYRKDEAPCRPRTVPAQVAEAPAEDSPPAEEAAPAEGAADE